MKYMYMIGSGFSDYIYIRADNKGYEDIMGSHGLRQMNENGSFACLYTLNK
jgi:hypothetical protein